LQTATLPLHDALPISDRDVLGVEAVSQFAKYLAKFGADLFEASSVELDEVHLVDRDQQLLDAKHRRYRRMPASLLKHPLAGDNRSEEHTSELQSRENL